MAGKTIGMVKDLKKGKYVLIDDVPCKVVDIQTSKPGKHGAAKARVTAIGVFDGSKKQLLKPMDANCEIPMVDRRKGQVIADLGDNIQLMDMETYETFEMKKPTDIAVETGAEVEYMDVMGQKMITRK
ncbi:MAG: translation initiation factor IF-5A [Candidatus Diapherotrites archaeon]|nr:translation initiation factor IF-5A [Candidatus Diapherotrites archaeon]